MIHHATRDLPPSALDDCLASYALVGFVEVQPPPGIAGRAAWLEAARGEQRTQIHLASGRERTEHGVSELGEVGELSDTERLPEEGDGRAEPARRAPQRERGRRQRE